MNLDNTIPEGKGIYVFSDPAGANSVLAIVDRLILLGHLPKKDFLVFTNSMKTNLDEYKSILDISLSNESDFADVIKSFNPTYIFSGTSLNDFEHLWRKAAIQENVKVISFIDHWTSYIQRFSFNNEIIFGNEIWVINDIAKNEAIHAGIPEKLLIVSGNPYYKKVKKFQPKVSKEEFFNFLSLDINKKMILFISDDIKSSFPSDENGFCVLGFDEYTILTEFIIALKSLDVNLQDFQLVLKLHPKSDLNKFKELINDEQLKLDLITIKDCDSLTINYFSDYVIGMFSNMVIESFLMNKKILRIQIGQIGEDLMKFKKLNGKVIVKRDDLENNINNFFKPFI
tara:strand:+ start:2116 stop:3141 length:1026 start_codon:yes stop_codon:yes gene_type:complete